MIQDLMKQKWFILCLAALAVCSCGKQGPAAFRGYYSFKTGGAVDITGKVYDIRRDTVSIDTVINEVTFAGRIYRDTTYVYDVRRDTVGSRDTVFLRYLVAESGQMHVLEDGGKMVLTMNITGGDPVVVPAHVDGNRLVLEEVDRRVPVSIWQESGSNGNYSDERYVNCYWKLSGQGRRLENMLLMDLEYKGDYSYDGFGGVVTGSRVNLIATENE